MIDGSMRAARAAGTRIWFAFCVLSALGFGYGGVMEPRDILTSDDPYVLGAAIGFLGMCATGVLILLKIAAAKLGRGWLVEVAYVGIVATWCLYWLWPWGQRDVGEAYFLKFFLKFYLLIAAAGYCLYRVPITRRTLRIASVIGAIFLAAWSTIAILKATGAL